MADNDQNNPIPPVPADSPDAPADSPAAVPSPVPPAGLPHPYAEWCFDEPIVRINTKTYNIMVGIDPQFKDTARIELHVPVPPGLTEPPVIVHQGDILSIETIFEPQVNADVHNAFAVAVVGQAIASCIVNVRP